MKEIPSLYGLDLSGSDIDPCGFTTASKHFPVLCFFFSFAQQAILEYYDTLFTPFTTGASGIRA